MHKPLAILGLFFILGILFAVWSGIPLAVFYWFALLGLILSLAWLKNRFWFAAFIYLASFFVGATVLRNAEILPNCHIAKIISAPATVSVRGVIDSDPLVTGNKSSFIFRAEEVIGSEGGQRSCGKILVGVFKDREFYYGQELILTGALYRPYKFSLSPHLNYRDYLQRKNIHLLLSVKKNSEIRDLGVNKGNPVMLLAVWLKHKMEEAVDKTLSPLPSSILNAMLLGERKAVPRLVNDAMIKSGTVHILVVSGFNVGIVAFIMLTFFKVLRIPRRLRLWFTMILLIVYCLLTGASTSVIRATVMGLVLILGYLIEREPDLYNSLALAAIIILACNPWQIMDIGFQLSFISVWSIAWLYPNIKSMFPGYFLRIRYLNALIQVFAVSLSAWLGTAGLIAYYFQIISPVTVLANMVIIPITSFITACGFALVIIGKVLPMAGLWFARSCELAIGSLLKINLFLIGLKGAYFYVPGLPARYVWGYYLAICGVFGSLNLLKLTARTKGFKS